MGAATAATHRRRRKSPSSTFHLSVIIVLVNLVNLQLSSVRSQSIDNGAGTASQLDNPAVVDLVTRTVYNRIYNQTHNLFDNEFADKFKFCILNR